jgi:Protein of unknown function (DUF2827)
MQQMESSLTLPGMARYWKEYTIDTKPLTSCLDLPELIQRPVVLLATASITTDNIFANGLFQNIFLFYRMFEAMGYMPVLVVNARPESKDKVPTVLQRCRLAVVEDLVKTPIPVKTYIEIGMSIDSQLRRFLRMCGAKICKLYLGNILNIDVETPVFYPYMNFNHHVIGELDEIWVSPHYAQHAEYACVLNHVSPQKKYPKIAPYIWDASVLTDEGRRILRWNPGRAGDKEYFVILEPNISFQKASLVPLMIAETWVREHPEWNGEIHVVNGERLMMIPFFREYLSKELEIFKRGLVHMHGRMDIVSVMTKWPSCIPICHQYNNEYNYMVLEFFWAGFPVLHNSSDWKEYGYYYKQSELYDARRVINTIRKNHTANLEVYIAHAQALAWRHSPYNPEVHKLWKRLVEEKAPAAPQAAK